MSPLFASRLTSAEEVRPFNDQGGLLRCRRCAGSLLSHPVGRYSFAFLSLRAARVFTRTGSRGASSRADRVNQLSATAIKRKLCKRRVTVYQGGSRRRRNANFTSVSCFIHKYAARGQGGETKTDISVLNVIRRREIFDIRSVRPRIVSRSPFTICLCKARNRALRVQSRRPGENVCPGEFRFCRNRPSYLERTVNEQ